MKKLRYLFLGATLLISGLTLASCARETVEEEPPINTPTSTVSIQGTLTCEVGQSVTLTANVTNDNTREGVSWTSSNEGVATISSSGVVTGVSAGTTTITATMVGNKDVKAEVTFTVTASTEPYIEIKATSNVGTVGSPFTLEAEVYNPNNRTLTYSWSAKNGKAPILNGSESTLTVTPSSEGDEIFILRVMIGQTPYETTLAVYFKDSYEGFVDISSASDFETFILNDADKDVTGKFRLTADIDLGGMKINGATSLLKLSGTLDGCGYTISNFEIVGNPALADDGVTYYYASTGMFRYVSGLVRNLNLKGYTNQEGVGWGSSLLTGNLSGTVQNCLVEYTNNYNQGKDGWFPFNGAVCGVLEETGKVINTVINVDGEGQGGAMAICAYPAGGAGEEATCKPNQVFTVDGVYTNQTPAATFGSTWQWGGPITTATNVRTELVFSSTPASTYSTLSPVLWNLVDNQMPTLNNI